MSKHQESEARLQDIQVRHTRLCFVSHSKYVASFSGYKVYKGDV